MTRLVSPAAIAIAALLAGGSALAKPPKKSKAAPAASAPSAPSAPSGSVETPRGAVPSSQIPRRASATPAPAAEPGGARTVVQRESHIEFDERLVQGQTAAGAIYLFQRGESEFRSMVRLPDSFRERTVREILPPPPSQKQ